MRKTYKKSLFSSILIICVISFSLGCILYGYSKNKYSNDISSDHGTENDNLYGNKVTFDESADTSSTDLLLTFIGDCTLGSDPNFSYNTFHQKYEDVEKDPNYFFSNVSHVFEKDDLTIANFEGTLTTSNLRAFKKFTFKGPPEYSSILTAGSIEAVNLANNHSLDFLNKGFIDTKNTLDDEGIKHFGLGEVYKTDIKDYKLAFIGYKGWLDTISIETMKKEISSLKQEGFIVIANFHWGLEGRHVPIGDQKLVAHSAIDSGADFVIGHHPHVVQSMEIYKDRLIAYSLGNFCFGGNSNPRDKRTFILQIKLAQNNDNNFSSYFKIIPAYISSSDSINDFRPTIMESPEDREGFFHFLGDISPDMPFELSDDLINIFTETSSDETKGV
ncbi:CapA family protein [Oceanirhabdus seepicola]|uniref:CapA family protein n=1 Tax=Oceanirhabdus seepicola TaxID=2828781 RepID=A0A9J6P0Y0_9CLOT|nr:CapA family protein [Oceanirhabdus seepicola]MCM1990303.1 CapA family protein [Oceanirhabdus seepicola]